MLRIIIVILILQTFAIHGTLTPKTGKSKSRAHDASFDAKLIKSQPHAREIIANCESVSNATRQRRMRSPVLGYVTPWNNEGYNIAKLFAHKFTHISPVWLQIRPNKPQLHGTHDIDVSWMQDVRSNGNVRIVPRVLFEHWTRKQFIDLLSNGKRIDGVASTLIDTAKQWKFDGFVVEIWSMLAGQVPKEQLITFIILLAKKLAEMHLDCFLVIPPKRNGATVFSNEDYAHLKDVITGFSLMTYDFSNIHRPGPNAPLAWIEDCIRYLSDEDEDREQILTGFNFYGMEFKPSGGGPIINRDYLQKLSRFDAPLEYDAQSAEHFFEIRETDGKHIIFYPTLHSIKRRLDLVRDFHTGVSIWELGQGLPYFYNLL